MPTVNPYYFFSPKQIADRSDASLQQILAAIESKDLPAVYEHATATWRVKAQDADLWLKNRGAAHTLKLRHF